MASFKLTIVLQETVAVECTTGKYYDYFGDGVLQTVSLVAIVLYILISLGIKIWGRIQYPIREYTINLIIWSVLFAFSATTCTTDARFSDLLIPDILLVISVLFCANVIQKTVSVTFSGNEHAILLIGAPASGKTYLAYGLMKYLSGKYDGFSHGEDSMSRALMQEVESAHSRNDFSGATIAGKNSNKISFAIDDDFGKEFSIYDFSGESLKNYTPVNRLGKASPLHTETILALERIEKVSDEVIDHEDEDEDRMVIHRKYIRHIVFLINPKEDGTYPHGDAITALQSNLKLTEELTMRTSNARRSTKYTQEVKELYPHMRRIKIHCVFTQFSNREDSLASLTSEALEELGGISNDLLRLVKSSKGKCIYVNVVAQRDGTICHDMYMIDTLAQQLVS